MGIVKTWVEVNESVGNAVGDGIVDLANGIATGACSLLNKYPNALPLVPYARGFVNGVCSSIGQPLPEASVPFQGGQCEGVSYRVFIEYTFGTTGTDETQDRAEILTTVTGAIVSFTDNGNSDASSILVNVKTTGNPGGTNYFKNLGFGSELVPGTLTVTFPPVNPSEDVCGDPPSQLPPDPPIDPADFNQPITVNEYNSNGDIINSDTYVVNYDSADFSQFDFTLNVGGMPVQVDIDGINIGGGGTGEGQKSSEERKDIADKCGGGGVFNPEDLVEIEGEETEEEIEIEASEIEYLLIDVTEPPDSGRTYVSDNSENIHFNAAYLRWTGFNEGQGYSFPDIPIRRLQTIHKRPDDAGGYVAYAVNGAKIRISKFVAEEEG